MGILESPEIYPNITGDPEGIITADTFEPNQGAGGTQQIPTWGASRISLPRLAPLIYSEQHSRTKVIDLRCQPNCAHKVRLQTPLGPKIVHLVALMV